ncbi:MAG: hypothetical protein KGL39_35440 [Patescibacteria group bacterium]|nr:hypothetical protein [Patescibacteria group bacterium]
MDASKKETKADAPKKETKPEVPKTETKKEIPDEVVPLLIEEEPVQYIHLKSSGGEIYKITKNAAKNSTLLQSMVDQNTPDLYDEKKSAVDVKDASSNILSKVAAYLNHYDGKTPFLHPRREGTANDPMHIPSSKLAEFWKDPYSVALVEASSFEELCALANVGLFLGIDPLTEIACAKFACFLKGASTRNKPTPLSWYEKLLIRIQEQEDGKGDPSIQEWQELLCGTPEMRKQLDEAELKEIKEEEDELAALEALDLSDAKDDKNDEKKTEEKEEEQEEENEDEEAAGEGDAEETEEAPEETTEEATEETTEEPEATEEATEDAEAETEAEGDTE